MDRRGKTEAEAVIKVLEGREVRDQIIAVSFDTTASNTSAEVGACRYIEDYVGWPDLWLACRHNIAELVVREAWAKIFETKTSCPKVQLFETLKKSWQDIKDKIDYSQIQKFDISSLSESLKPLARRTLQHYYNNIKGNSVEKEKERQDLLQVVQHYRKQNPNLLKATLANK